MSAVVSCVNSLNVRSMALFDISFQVVLFQRTLEMSEKGKAELRAEDAHGSWEVERRKEEDMAAKHNNNVVVGAKVTDQGESVVNQGIVNPLEFVLNFGRCIFTKLILFQ